MLDRKPAPIVAIIGLAFAMLVSACAPMHSARWYDFKHPKERRYGRTYVAPNLADIVVQEGDTYYSLARKYKVPLRALMELSNARPPFALTPGVTLKLPRQNFYIVSKGDTLYSVSRKFKIDVASLAKANSVPRPYTINPGQSLQVPGGQASKAEKTKKRSPAVRVASRVSPKATSKSAPPKKVAKKSRTLPQAPKRVGRFLLPVRGRVISDYGPKPGGLHNDGLNIAASAGAPVKAAENGVVVYAGNELRGYGNLLLLRHSGGWVTAYAHISSFKVRPGARVKQGQVIGAVGSSGNVDRPQVHFEIRKGSQAVNPNSLI